MSGYHLITDGAYSSSGDQGGAAFIIINNNKKVFEYAKMFKHTSNNQMELLAIILGLKCFIKPIDKLIIVSDSMYCIGCASLGWKRKKNVKLWNLFDKEYQRVSKLCSNIEFKHIRGHQKDSSEETKWNNRCDELAVLSSQQVES